ncbi:nucleoside hydrolase [Myxosarcina sp. GI1]|uniref:nucleoside hydrolase n=1 Tax=Myxosarcina sp. GI1 TaxID=1541065 RepID=UPI00068CC6E2|nr:nucleoside hydrolase [Myxosarcina sp. GI1]
MTITNYAEPTPLIIDDDGSQDGMTAVAYMLANPQFDVKAITIAQGIARPEIFEDNLLKMLKRLDDLEVPVGVGRSTPLEGNNQFPNFIRDGADTFWSPYVSLPEETPDVATEDAVDLIIDTIQNSPEPVAILATGTLTNIAEALRREPSIIDNIEIVQIMGGAVFTEGNLPVLPEPPYSTNTDAEFNTWVDPVAAQEVFDAGEKGLKIQLTPLDATNQIEFDLQDYQAWLDTGTPESTIAAEFLNYALEVIQSGNDPNPVWDLVAAINLSEPKFSPETPLHLDIDTESAPGDTQGETIAVPDLPPNTLVSLDPSFDNLSFTADEVFSYLEELPTVDESIETVFGSVGDDLIDSSELNSDFDGNNDILFAGSGDDLIDASLAFGHNRIYAGGGDDILLAGSNNRLIGNLGKDTFFIGTGSNNLVTGGVGADQFWILSEEGSFPTKPNVITDFKSSEGDVIGFANTSLDFDTLKFVADGNNTIIRAFNTDLAVLANVEATQISESDIVFA